MCSAAEARERHVPAIGGRRIGRNLDRRHPDNERELRCLDRQTAPVEDAVMNEALRDSYLAEVAATVEASLSHLADGLQGLDPREELMWGDVHPALRRLRTRVNDAATRADLLAVVREVLVTAAHSQLVILDGGTALSDNGRQVYLVDSTGNLVADGLHEWLFDHFDD